MQWRPRYKKLYSTDICKEWTPIFPVLNGTVTYQQFPLKPATASTIHGCQGSTFSKIKIDIKYVRFIRITQNTKYSQLCLQHAYYVAPSCLALLESLQIINWNPHLISINKRCCRTNTGNAD